MTSQHSAIAHGKSTTVMGAPGSTECAKNATLMHAACDQMGLPVEPEKDERPSTSLVFLSIELDSSAMEIHLPAEKLTRLRKELAGWRARKKCKKRELLSLIGLLSHACKVVRSGRSFLRRLIDLSTIPKHLEHYVRLNVEARSDIEWWVQYSQIWNGVSMTHLPNNTSPAAVLTSDACMGVWSLCWIRLVHAPMARLNCQLSHHSEGANSHCNSGGHMGASVAKLDSAGQM